MNANDYQYSATKTAIYPEAGTGSNRELYYLAMGMAGEAGELAGKISKLYRDGTINHQDLGKECGDVLWYVALMAKALGYNLSNIMEANLTKLNRRKESGTLSGSGDNR